MRLEIPQPAFATFLSESSFLNPHRFVESAWVQHVPFAFWFVEQVKPKVFVELGVHTGMSYFAFCQSIKANTLPTLCYGIDTWKGDEHAGAYSEDVWQDVQRYNAQEYASFSYLLRTTFEEALPYFEDQTIDLLHIDGYHTYEAVKQDFESWLPKMSANGVIIFHDTVVRERDFGVYKLWHELKQQYKSFEFLHGHGLGVLALAPSAATVLHTLFEWESEAEISKLRRVYATLGAKLTDNAGISTFEKQLAYANAQYTNLKAQHEQLQAEHKLLHQGYELLTNLAEEVKNEQQDLQTEMQSARQQTAQAHAELEEAKAVGAAWQVEANAAKTANEDFRTEIAHYKQVHANIDIQYNSLQQEHTHLQDQYNNQQEQHNKLKEQYNKLQDLYTNDKEKLQNLQEQHKYTVAQVTELQEQAARSKGAYQQLKTQYEVLKKWETEAKKEQAMRQMAAEKTAQELKKAQAALQDAKEAFQLLEQQTGGTINELNQQLADTKRALAEMQAHADRLNIELGRQLQVIQWYKRTYEDRSLLGTIKEKLRSRQKA